MIKVLTDELNDVVITPNAGFTLLYNNSVRMGNLLIASFGIKKTNGNFKSDDEVCATLDISASTSLVTYCGLASGSDWTIENIGYCFISKNTIISDRNGLNKYNRAHVNTIVKIK